MMHTKQAVATSVVALLTALAAFGQDDDSRRRGQSSDAAAEVFGLSEEQVDQIDAIRRERPPRGQDREARRTWVEERRSKIQAVLTDEQKAKLEEARESAAQLRAFAAAARMGLVEGGRTRFGPGMRDGRGDGRRGGPRFGPRRGGARGPGYRRGGNDRRGARQRGRRGGPNRGGGRGGR